MGSNRQRREAAQRKAKKKRLTIIAVGAASFAAIIIALAIYSATRPDIRVFAVPGGQSVVLRENGSFVANLFHDAEISGTYTEDESGSVTTISFTHGGNTVSTQIEGDVLMLPAPWRATCRFHSHEIGFPRVR